jgi:hypothetical protein
MDSLLPQNVQAYLPGIKTIDSEDFDQMMFYYPIKMGRLQLILCGFADTEKYNAIIRTVPFSFIYPFAVAFLLLLVFLPILKFYIMDENEPVRIRDFVMFGMSIFVGASVLTLVIIQYLLWKGEEERARDNLHRLSYQIHDGLLQELDRMYTQLLIFDSLKIARENESEWIKDDDEVNFSHSVQSYMQDCADSNFYFFDRISWINPAGDQVIKAETRGGKTVPANVKDRQYFRAFAEHRPYYLSNRFGQVRKYGWEPIYSWTNGDFNVSISRQPEDTDTIVALASKMHSVVNTVLPVGYGFCIIDKNGKVQLHSDVNRNLRENLFEKAEPSNSIISSAVARQPGDMYEVHMYGKWYIMHIRPIKDLPYSIVTFYDRGFIVPVNMRILTFAFLFGLFSWLSCAALWSFLARVNFRKYPLLYCPMDCFTWLMPRKKEGAFYVYGSVFLIMYVLLFLVFIFLHGIFFKIHCIFMNGVYSFI